MLTNIRHDRGQIKAITTEQGYLRADAWLTRAGVFTYQNADGSLRREYRPESEVFDAASMSTLVLSTLTHEHPPEFLDPTNNRNFAIGKVGQDISRDGRWLRGTVQVDDANALKAIQSGKIELSCGYSVDYDPTPGVTPEGLSYDGVQKNIRYNHLSLVTKGRATDGSERAALKLDAATEQKTMNLKIAGEQHELDEAVGAAVERERSAVQAKLDTLQSKLDEALEQNKRDMEASIKAIDAAVKARVALEVEARKHGVETTDKTDREIREAVIMKLQPSAKLDGRDDTYVAARFDSELDAFVAQESVKNDQEVLNAANAAPEPIDDYAAKLDAARKEYIEKINKA